MGQALWCDAKNADHPINAYAATVVTGKAATFHYCGPHTHDALKKAMVIVGTERVGHLHYPPVGDIVLTCDRPVDVRTGVPAGNTGADAPGTPEAGSGTD